MARVSIRADIRVGVRVGVRDRVQARVKVRGSSCQVVQRSRRGFVKHALWS